MATWGRRRAAAAVGAAGRPGCGSTQWPPPHQRDGTAVDQTALIISLVLRPGGVRSTQWPVMSAALSALSTFNSQCNAHWSLAFPRLPRLPSPTPSRGFVHTPVNGAQHPQRSRTAPDLPVWVAPLFQYNSMSMRNRLLLDPGGVRLSGIIRLIHPVQARSPSRRGPGRASGAQGRLRGGHGRRGCGERPAPSPAPTASKRWHVGRLGSVDHLFSYQRVRSVAGAPHHRSARRANASVRMRLTGKHRM